MIKHKYSSLVIAALALAGANAAVAADALSRKGQARDLRRPHGQVASPGRYARQLLQGNDSFSVASSASAAGILSRAE